MNIGFMTTWPKKMKELEGKPTYFPEKILTSLIESRIQLNWQMFGEAKNIAKIPPYEFSNGAFKPKHHTIRENKKGRYSNNVVLQPFIWTNKPYRSPQFYFSPNFKCVSTQIIQIIHSGEKWRMPWVMVDGFIMTAPEIEVIAHNDGFDSTKDFFKWFDTDFTGDIIHWTNLKY
tara:strand:+ start:10931 stop:11452 length:522 start_codon:yes stop_codon:yes gene_type:complete